MVGEVADDAHLEVRRRAQLEAHAALGEAGHDIGVRRARDAVPDPRRPEQLDGVEHLLGAP